MAQIELDELRELMSRAADDAAKAHREGDDSRVASFSQVAANALVGLAICERLDALICEREE